MNRFTRTLPVNKNGLSEWGIREFANFFEITPRAVRFYEDKGLLSPKRQKGGRMFTPVDYLRLENILRAKRLGFTLDDIKNVLDVTDGHVQDRAELMRRKENIERVIRSLQRRREDIDVLSRDMIEICDILSENLSNIATSGEASKDEIFDLASRYEAAFKDKLSFQGTADPTSAVSNPLATSTALEKTSLTVTVR